MFEQGADEWTVLVEARRGTHDRHDAVSMGELEETVDRLIAEPCHYVAKLLLGVELVLELSAPASLVRCERRRVEAIAGERVHGHVRRQRCAHDAVMNAA